MTLRQKQGAQNPLQIQKKTVLSLKNRLFYAFLVGLYLFCLTRYALWWFQPAHIPTNWASISLHLLDFIIFSMLSFVVFAGTFSQVGSWFAIWYAAKPVFKAPKKELKVAFFTCYVPGKEPFSMLVRTLSAMKAVKYPHDTWVLDEGDDDEVKRLCKDLKVHYFTRKGMEKYNQPDGIYLAKTKAGNQNAWRAEYENRYDFVAQIDMDHVPTTRFLNRTLGYFDDPSIGIICMPQFYENTHNWIARGAAEQGYFFHGPMQQGYYGSDMPLMIGTSHIYRTKAMKEIGGYSPTIVEDHLTGMRFYAHGWKGVFVPEILAKGEGPRTWMDYFNQQMRWSYGLFEILFKHTPKYIMKLTIRQKVNYFLAQLYYFTGVAVLIGTILTVLYLVFGVRAASMNLFEWILFSLPPFLLSNAIQMFVHKFSIDPKNEPVFGIAGMFLGFAVNIIYALAFIQFITGRKLTYVVTRKGEEADTAISIHTFLPHISIVLVLVVSLIISILTSHTAIQLRFWAWFNIFVLTAVVISAYIHQIFQWWYLKRMSQKVLRVGTMIIFVCLFLSGFYLMEQAVIVDAVAARFDAKKQEETLAGKVVFPQNQKMLGVILEDKDERTLTVLEERVHKHFAVVGYYQSWGAKNNSFKNGIADHIANRGAIPLITWEPWKPVAADDMIWSSGDQPKYRLKKIAHGAFDSYIHQYAKDVASYKKQVVIRFAQEMNGNWYPWGSTLNTPQEYIAAYRHIHEIFNAEDATNVTWMWSPNEMYEEEKVPNASKLSLFYPGDDYVDIVGFSSFNWGYSYNRNTWREPAEMFDATIAALKEFKRPIVIAETATADAQNNPSLKARWIQKLSEYVASNTDIKAVLWFNAKNNGIDWRIDTTPQAVASFDTAFTPFFSYVLQKGI